MTGLLILSHDVVDERMAGPGIRYWEMARALSAKFTVTLATPGRSLPYERFASQPYAHGDWSSLAPAVSRADLLMLSGDLFMEFPQLETCGKPLIIEATYPYTFEGLQLHSSLPRQEQMPGYLNRLETMHRAARAGDFFFCASQRQRAYWLGVLDAVGRLNPDTYAADKSLYQLIDIVPFGLPSRRPKHTAPSIKGIMPGIGPRDKVILWGGGLWEWLDSLALVRAIARLADLQPNVRLVFPATRHPNPAVPDMPMHHQTRELSDRLGLTNKLVFFGDWVPYELWQNYLLEADIGASLHFDTLETHFAFRTRILDYIWAGLPMVVTGGDSTSEVVARHGLGEVVPPDDPEAVAAALLRLLDLPNLREAYRAQFEQVRPDFTWERACEPIVHFCQEPRFAADRAPDRQSPGMKSHPSDASEYQAEIAQLRSLVARYERGRFIQLMRRVGQIRRRIFQHRFLEPWVSRLCTERFYWKANQEVGKASDHAFVDAAYWLVLKRAPDKTGFQHFTASLAQGRTSRRQVVASLVASDEFRTQPPPVWGITETLHKVRRHLVGQLPQAEHILDLGGATPNSIQGALLVMGYPHRVHSLTIVDIVPADGVAQARCGDNGIPGEWIETDRGPVRHIHTSMTDLSAIESSSMDLVIAAQSIEHLAEEDAARVMSEVLRVLRPGGHFCLDTPNRVLTRIQSPDAFLHPEHQVEYEVQDLLDRLRKAGFEIKEAKGICPMPRTVQTGVFDEQELLRSARLSDKPEVCYAFYVDCVKPDQG